MAKTSLKWNLRRIVWQSGIVIAGLIVWRFIYLARLPEMLGSPILGTGASIHRGLMYGTTREEDGNTIYASPLMGGRKIILAHEDANVEVSPNSTWLRFTETEVFYQIHPKPKPQILGGGGSAGGGYPTVFQGSFRPGIVTPVPGEKRVTFPRSDAPYPSYRLRRIPIRGGLPQDVPGVEANNNTQIVGDWVYWTKNRQNELTSITRGREWRQEIVGHTDLMATSLTTGETRKLASDLSADQALMPASDGVYWVAPRPYPDANQDLYYARASQPARLLIPDFQHNDDTNLRTLTEYNGRLYWIQYEKLLSPQQPALPARIVSANPDGQDTRLVLNLITAHLGTHGFLATYRGNLYFGCYRSSPMEQAAETSKSVSLCRLHPERKNPIEVLHQIEYGGYFDNDYFYYEASEKVGPLWDMLTGDDVNLKTISHLYRFHLPK